MIKTVYSTFMFNSDPPEFGWVISVCKSDFLHCELTHPAYQLNGS